MVKKATKSAASKKGQASATKATESKSRGDSEKQAPIQSQRKGRPQSTIEEDGDLVVVTVDEDEEDGQIVNQIPMLYSQLRRNDASIAQLIQKEAQRQYDVELLKSTHRTEDIENQLASFQRLAVVS